VAAHRVIDMVVLRIEREAIDRVTGDQILRR
jgi:hypothetical protein